MLDRAAIRTEAATGVVRFDSPDVALPEGGRRWGAVPGARLPASAIRFHYRAHPLGACVEFQAVGGDGQVSRIAAASSVPAMAEMVCALVGLLNDKERSEGVRTADAAFALGEGPADATAEVRLREGLIEVAFAGADGAVAGIAFAARDRHGLAGDIALAYANLMDARVEAEDVFAAPRCGAVLH